MDDVLGLQVNEKDNVATIFSNEAKKGMEIRVMDKSGGSRLVHALDDIPYGHKIALREIACGEAIVKYGQIIGQASRAIVTGDYVHIHNLESRRGRGDWEKKEA